MDISNVNLICFSPTNSTKKVLELLSGVWHKEVKHTDITDYANADRTGEYSDRDLVYIGVPSYGGRVPALALERLRNMRGHLTPAVLVATYGNRDYDDTLLELEEAVKKQGFCPVAAAAVVTEHSIMHQYGAGRPDEKDKEELKGFATQVREMILKVESQELAGREDSLGLKGTKPYKEYKGVPLKPAAGKKCTGCGLCAKKCPSGAIHQDDPKITDKDKCISCMRCVRICSNDARSVNKLLLMAAGLTMKSECAGRKNNEFYPR